MANVANKIYELETVEKLNTLEIDLAKIGQRGMKFIKIRSQFITTLL